MSHNENWTPPEPPTSEELHEDMERARRRYERSKSRNDMQRFTEARTAYFASTAILDRPDQGTPDHL